MTKSAARERRPKEIFIGPRLAVRVPAWARVRSTIVLALLSVVLGAALAAGVATATWYLVQAVSHAGS